MLFTLVKKPNIYINLSSKSLRKLLLINTIKRILVFILLSNMATLLKWFSKFFNSINIIKLSLY